MSSRPVVALALGGLGGFNAHDAGVLAAAHETGLVPDIITAGLRGWSGVGNNGVLAMRLAMNRPAQPS